jgi:hypothetical protein
VRSEGGLKRPHRVAASTGILCFVVVLVVCQIWLLSATMNAFLGGDDGVILPAALASLACLGLVGGLLVVARGIGRG